MENMGELKNALVTGGAGFIGSGLVNSLVKNGWRVAVVDNLSSGLKKNLNSGAKFYQADVRGAEIFGIFEKEKPEIIFHFAAQPIVETAYKNPKETIDINVMGTVNVLEASRRLPELESIIVCSSDKAYGKSKNLPYTENSALRGDHPYDVSKGAADLIAQAYFKTYGLPVVITRFSNVFGPGDVNFSRIIPGILRAAIKDEEFLVRSDGRMVREYTYIDDIARGCMLLAQNADKFLGQPFNFGSNNIFSVIELINKVQEAIGAKINYKILNIAKNEIPEQYLDWKKAEIALGWRPETRFNEAIIKTFDWYKARIL